MNRNCLLFAIVAVSAPSLRAQFSSGSTGADGALNLTPPFSGCSAAPCIVNFTVPFSPNGTAINGTNENVYNFTTISIASGVTLVMTAPSVRNRSVIWLATGSVTIAGSIVLDGQAGIAMGSNPGLTRAPATPGPGGFPGGMGGYLTDGPQPGGGYGGGGPAVYSYPGGNGVYSFYNSQLTPLIGGTGGGGGMPGLAGGNGGAGGGAIRIVSSTSVSITGSISAQGGHFGYPVPSNTNGNGDNGGYGSGGAIHLIAPTITGNGNLYICGGGNNGVVQFNSTTNSFTGALNGCGTPPFYSYGLYNPPLPTGTPFVRITGVDGVAAPQFPTGSFSVPDVTINASSSVTVSIAAQNIALGTIVTLTVTSESAPDATFSCAPLSGTLQTSTATCSSVNFPSGVGITEVKASW
jgi:hypothetical protein